MLNTLNEINHAKIKPFSDRRENYYYNVFFGHQQTFLKTWVRYLLGDVSKELSPSRINGVLVYQP